MTVLQAIIISLFTYLAAIGGVLGNTLGWYDLGRPLVASFVVGIVMGNVPVAVELGLMLQLANLGSVTPGGAVGWDLSYATYIGVAGALAFHNGDMATTTALMWAFSVVGGAIGVAMWNLHYAADLLINRVSTAGAEEGNSKKVAMANSVLGNLCGFAFRFIPAMVILMTTAVVGSQTGVDVSTLIPGWLLNTISIFGGIMAALGMGILLSFLMKKAWHFCVFLLGYCLVAYLGLSTMAVSVLGICAAVILYEVLSRKGAN